MANVKITALTDIGANILYTALIPMVNMAGTPTTEKGNIQILGNYILSGAGSANFAPAALSNLSYSVVNAAQPNITSVGTLTSLAVTGNVTSSSYVTANFFVGDGGLLTNLSVAGSAISNGTSNVAIPTAGGNISISRGGVANVLVVTGTGVNVTGLNVTGNVSSNLRPSANVTYDLGSANQRWKDIWLANSTIHLGDATLSANGNSIVVESITITDGNVGNIGNIASVNLSGDVNQVLRGDGTWGSGGSGNTGNVTFNNQIVIGTGDGYGGGGLYLAPGTDSVSNLQYFRVRGGDYPTHIHFDTGNSAYYDQYFGDDSKFVRLDAGSTGNVVVGTQGMSQSYTWSFGADGNLTLPNNTFAINYANGSPVQLGGGSGNTIGNFVVTGNMFMLNDPNVDMVIQQSANDITSIRLIPGETPDSGVHIETGNLSTTWHWVFADTGNFSTPGNVIMDGTQLFVGPGADLIPNVANSTLTISSNSSAFIQAIINNVSDIGSADWISQGHYGDDLGGYSDLGFNSAAFNNPSFDIAGAGDGYFYVQGYYNGQAPNQGGGNLIVCTGDQGLSKNIIFGTGGFTQADIFATISDANNAFEITRAGAYIQLPDGSVLDAGGLYGNDTAILANGSGAVQAYAQSAGVGIQTGDGNAIVHTWLFDNAGGITFPTLSVDLHNGGIQSAQTLQFNDPNQQAIITGPTPSANVNAQRMIIQGQRGNGTGEGGDVYIWAGDANTNGGDIKIYAGDADVSGYGGYINLDGGSGVNGGGQLTLTGGSSTSGSGGTIYITAGYSGGGLGAPVSINGGQSGTTDGGNVTITGGYGQANGGQVVITGGQSALGLSGYGNVAVAAGASTWTFDNTGNLTVPKIINGSGNSQFDIASTANEAYLTTTNDDSTALYMTAIEAQLYANSNVYINSLTSNVNLGADGDVIITANTGNVNKVWTFSSDGNLTVPGAIVTSGGSGGDITGANVIAANTFQSTVVAYNSLPSATTAGLRAFVNDANLVAAGNFGAAVSNGGSNIVPVYSDGSVWRIG